MDVYLMQHGEAMAAEVDPERPLTQEGAGHVRAVARRAARAGVRVERIVHSGKRRAEQTAAIVGAELGCPIIEPVAGLKPGDRPEDARRALLGDAGSSSLLVVGHLPFLDRFASLLVTDHADSGVLAFRNAAMVKLVPSATQVGQFRVAWILPPELAG